MNRIDRLLVVGWLTLWATLVVISMGVRVV